MARALINGEFYDTRAVMQAASDGGTDSAGWNPALREKTLTYSGMLELRF